MLKCFPKSRPQQVQFDTYTKGQEMKITDLVSNTLLTLPEETVSKVLKTKLVVVVFNNICISTKANKLYYIRRDTISVSSSGRLQFLLFLLSVSVIS